MPNPFKQDNKLRANRTIFRNKVKAILAIVVGMTIVLSLYHKSIQNKYLQADKELSFLSSLHIPSLSIDASKISQSESTTTISWCDKISQERSKLHKDLHITYPCDNTATSNREGQQHYKSAIVTYLTAGVEEGKGSKTEFTGKEFINGALALGASLSQHLTQQNENTLRLLLVKDGFTLPEIEQIKLEKVGWTIGKAPNVHIGSKYVPRYPRYKTVYTKLSALGLSEFECVLLLDADTLVVDNLDDLLSCSVLHKKNSDNNVNHNNDAKSSKNYMVAGTLDYYRGKWEHFNTGSILWNTNVDEMNRVYQLTKDESFMKRFGSDQIFLNAVYPDRVNLKKNELLVEEGFDLLDGNGNNSNHYEHWGNVANLGWRYNVQTHVEVQLPNFWEEHFSGMKIIHYTAKKGWQCPEQYGSSPAKEDMVSLEKCTNKTEARFSSELCFCGLGYLWWDALKLAEKMAE